MSQPFVSRNDALTTLHTTLDRHAKARLREFSRGETVYEPGMDDIVGYVVSGAVKQVVLFPDGRSNIIGLIEAPGFFGRVFGGATEFVIEAASDVVLACFDRQAFEAQLSRDPHLERFVHMENLHQLDEAHERIIVLACQSVIERICTFMLLKLIDGAQTSVVHVPINRRDFAGYLGTTVESVSRSVQALVRRGTIAVIDSSNFKVLRRDDLIDISRQDEESLREMVRSRGPKRAGRGQDLPFRDDRSFGVVVAAE